MQYIRASRHDYDRWAALGNPGWSYDDMLPYFKKSENQLNPEYAKNGSYRENYAQKEHECKLF